LFSCFAPAFIGLSFAVRTVRPVLEALENDVEEAACPGTDRLQTFAGLMFPALFTSQLTTFTLAFVRWVGECGSTHLHCRQHADGFGDHAAAHHHETGAARATVIAAVMLAASFLVLSTVNIIHWWSRQYIER
jgi:sulfate transport system permease protein